MKQISSSVQNICRCIYTDVTVLMDVYLCVLSKIDAWIHHVFEVFFATNYRNITTASIETNCPRNSRTNTKTIVCALICFENEKIRQRK